MAIDTINIDEEEARVDEALAKAKADKTQQLLAEQEKKILSLMAEQGFSEADARKALNDAMSKGRTNEAIADTSYYGDPTASEKAELNQKTFANSKANAPKGYDRTPMLKDPSGDMEDTRNAAAYRLGKNFGGWPPKPDETEDQNQTETENQNQTETEKDNWFLEQLTPKVNEALKAIADKDPELLQHPAIRELYDQARVGRNLQMAYATVAPWTHNPELTLQQANAFRTQSDKNLTDAAENLEKLRQRQYEATKAVADDLTRQKGILQGLGSSVLGFQGNGLMVLPSVYESAINANLEGNKVHEVGDARLKAAGANAKSFLDSSVDAMLKTDKKNKAAGQAVLNDLRTIINNGELNEASWYDRIDPNTGAKLPGIITRLSVLKDYLEEGSQPVLQQRIDQMNEDLAAYKAAMAAANQYKYQSDVAMKKGEQIFNTISGVGKSFKMPLMSLNAGGASFNAPERQAPVGDIEAAYGKTETSAAQEPEKTPVVPGRQPKTGTGTGDDDAIETGDGTKKLYNNTTKILDKYIDAKLNAANFRANFKEKNTSKASADRAEALEESARLDAFKTIADLYNKSGKEGKESKVMFHLLNNAKYRGIIDDMFPKYDNAIQRIWNYYSGPKAVSPELSMNGNRAIMEQNDIIQRLMQEAGLA